MAQRTQIKPNGKPGHYELEWSIPMKWAAGILSSLIIAGVIGTLALHRRFAVVEAAVTRLEKSDAERVTRTEFDRHNHRGTAAREDGR
jgi:hypothetical protein